MRRKACHEICAAAVSGKKKHFENATKRAPVDIIKQRLLAAQAVRHCEIEFCACGAET
jgi:hypothetical protein